MISALLLDDTKESGSLEAAISMLRGQSAVGEILIATEREDLSIDPLSSIIQRDSMTGAFIGAVTEAQNTRIIVLSTALSLTPDTLAAFISEADSLPTPSNMFIPITINGEMAEMPSFSPEGLIESIRRNSSWPLLGVTTSRTQLLNSSLEDATSVTEMIARAFIMAYGQGDAVEAMNGSGAVASEGIASALCDLDDGEVCRVLKTAIDSFNIEELFPTLAWRDFSSESAAAAYHSLAALFIRVGDLESANQCLSHSEQLEESPRYFALKGLIARERGETLGAVANMVSSLQCYEARKRQSEEHYLSFQPADLEDINSQLVEGLNALNRRDNETALAHFSRAVFQFDPFYIELGVRSRPS